MTYQNKMTQFQLNTAEYLAHKKIPYHLGANYCWFENVNIKRGFDCASAAMFCIENAVGHEVLTGNQNVIMNETKKKDGYFRLLKEGEREEPGDLCLVNYPKGHVYDMRAYAYDGFYYPDPQDHVFTIGRNETCIDTGYDDDLATVIKQTDYSQARAVYIKLGAKLTFLRVCYDNIKKYHEGELK